MVHVKDITFETGEDFKGGVYEVTVRDITKSIDNKMADVKIELTIHDPQEAAAQAQAAAQAKAAPAKKK